METLKKIIEKQDEIIEKKSTCISYLIKIILRNAKKITIRTWESNYIHNYSETWNTLESELASLKAHEEIRENCIIPYLKIEADHQIEKITKIIGHKPAFLEQGVNTLIDMLLNPGSYEVKENGKLSAEEVLDIFIDQNKDYFTVVYKKDVLKAMAFYASQFAPKEISDEEIETAYYLEYGNTDTSIARKERFIKGAKWYREHLKVK